LIDEKTNLCKINRLNFAEKNQAGFIATPSTPRKSIIKKLRIYTNAQNRDFDPKQYVISGRNSESDPWTEIAAFDKVLTRRRNKHANIAIVSTFESGDSARNYDEVIVDNDQAFWQYKLIFPMTFRNSKTYLEMAEVELPGYLV